MAKKRKTLVKDLTTRGRRIRAQKRHSTSPFWKRKAHCVWSLIVRRGGVCELCEAKADTVQLQAHHLLGKDGNNYPHLRFDLQCGLCVCSRCHKTARCSCHGNPVWFSAWLLENKPMVYNWVLAHIPDQGIPMPDPYQAYVRLCREAQRLGLVLAPEDSKRMVELDQQPAAANLVPVTGGADPFEP